MWEEELKKRWYLHHHNKELGHFTTCDEEVISFIKSLLEEQRDKYYYEIENSVGTGEADYIDKKVNAPEPKG